MKRPILYINAVAVIILYSLSGCASGGNSVGHSPTPDPVIHPDSSMVTELDTSSRDTVDTAAGDSVSTPEDSDAPMTIRGSTESNTYGRLRANVIDVNGDGSVQLDDYLRTVAGVHVLGHRHHAQIRIRGYTSVSTQTSALGGGHEFKNDPLFIIDGVQFGRDFSEVYFYVNLSEVRNIEVIKGPDTAIYGSQGSAGVILINHYSARDPKGND